MLGNTKYWYGNEGLNALLVSNKQEIEKGWGWRNQANKQGLGKPDACAPLSEA